MIYMFLYNNPSSGDINSTNLSVFYVLVFQEYWVLRESNIALKRERHFASTLVA